MNIGIIGGTFDPIHNGHIQIASAALREYKLDKIWFMPAGDPYFKAGSIVTNPKLRLEMTKAAIVEYDDKFEVCDIEINDIHETHTADTLIKLHELYKNDRFFFILGLDSLLMLHKWYKPDVILSNAVILCALRDTESNSESLIKAEADKLKLLYPSVDVDIRMIHTPQIDISSTMLRKMVSKGLSISKYVSPKIEDIIKSNKLYRNI